MSSNRPSHEGPNPVVGPRWDEKRHFRRMCRTSGNDPFDSPTPLFALLPDASVCSPSVTGDGLWLYAGYRAMPPPGFSVS
jgi:hypothetical protein